jgi:hypothetical protein
MIYKQKENTYEGIGKRLCFAQKIGTENKTGIVMNEYNF